ncbi:MAG: hypothetical protein QM770_07980 [Tepidisphaeraceae bacterium]
MFKTVDRTATPQPRSYQPEPAPAPSVACVHKNKVRDVILSDYGVRVSAECVNAWLTRGVYRPAFNDRVVLASFRVGGRVYVRADAVREFMDALNAKPAADAVA